MRTHRIATAFAAAAALFVAAAPAGADRQGGGDDPGVVEFPSALVPDEATLGAAVRTPGVHTVVILKGSHPLNGTLNVFRRDGLRICGKTGRASDVELLCSASVPISVNGCNGILISGLTIRSNSSATTTVGVLIDQSKDVEISNVTITSVANAGECVRMQSAVSTEVEGFAEDVRIRRCRLDAAIPVRGLVRAKDLEVSNSRLTVTKPNGAGILWEDGEGLFVFGNRFDTTDATSAIAAVFVRGAQVATAEGQRARHVLIARNKVVGEHTTGFDLADIVDAQVSRNQVTFDTPVFLTANPDPQGQPLRNGRVGFVVRRASASDNTEDYELKQNLVRGAHTGYWFLNVSNGRFLQNSVKGCGDVLADSRFADTGCAARFNFPGPCTVLIDRNDFRSLRSPITEPACVITPAAAAAQCFRNPDLRNRVEPGRNLFETGAAKR